jgi:hypothetical protein
MVRVPRGVFWSTKMNAVPSMRTALPLDGEVGVNLFAADRFGIAVSCQRHGEPDLFVEQVEQPEPAVPVENRIS